MAGHTCLAAYDGEQAVALARQNYIDAVLLDWNLPGLYGISLVASLRMTTRQDIPIIVTSADPRSFDEAEKISPSLYLPKPYSYSALIECFPRVAYAR
jgi:DNA-binding response OmpR family regulator